MDAKSRPVARLTRRRLLTIAAATPFVILVGSASSTAGAFLAQAARAMRPTADGTSATRCARCGDPSHRMLAAGCPAGREIR